MKRQLPSQLLEEQFFSPATRQAPLSESTRLGAQLMLQKVAELEVKEFLGRDHYQRNGDGVFQGYRNGYEDKLVQTAEGPLHLKMPQVRDAIEAFDSVWLRALAWRSDKLATLIPQLYVKGLSTRDIEAALTDTLEVEGVSKSTVSTLCGQLKKDFEQWQNRDLTEHKILYLFCDGIYLRLRPEDERAAAVLCAYGIRADGKKVLLHLAVGHKESTVCWKSFFQDMKQRGLVEPLLVILDGNSGLRKVVRDCFPGSWVQRCQVHRMRNILCKLPEKARPGLKKLIRKAFTAQNHKAGLEQLCRTYWYPLYAYVRRRGYGHEDAQDLTQGFLVQLLGRRSFARVERNKGRFRSFLLAGLNYFLAGQRDRASAQKRGGGHPILSFDAQEAEQRYRLEPVDDRSPDRLFERSWALALLDSVLVRLEQEFREAGKAELFQRLRVFLVAGTGQEAYADVGAEVSMTGEAVKKAMHRLRHRYYDLFRAEIAQTVADPAEVEDEMRYLCAVMAG